MGACFSPVFEFSSMGYCCGDFCASKTISTSCLAKIGLYKDYVVFQMMTASLIAQMQMLMVDLVEQIPLSISEIRMIVNILILEMDSLDSRTILQTLQSKALCRHHGRIFS